MPINYIVLLISSVLLGVFFIFYGLYLKKIQNKNSILSSVNNSRNFYKGFIDNVLDKIPFLVKEEEKTNKYMITISDKINVRTFTKIKLFGILLSFGIAIYFKNLLSFVPLVMIFWNLPNFLFEFIANKRMRHFEDQFIDALQIFITDFTTIKSVRKSLTNITPQLKNPLKEEFERLNRELNSGESIEKSFVSFAERTKNKWVLVFSQLMITYFRIGGDITEQVMNITKRINAEKINDEENTTELSMLRMLNIVLNMLVPVIYGISMWLNPEDTAVFINTAQGQLVILAVLCSCVLSLWIGKKITQA